MKKYHYLNTDLRNIKGEQWKDIPGLEFYLKISNYGRIKRLAYEQDCKNGMIRRLPERIIRPMVAKQHNNLMNDNSLHLSTPVQIFKRRYNFSIARMVYNCFVEPFNTEDHSIVIFAIDGDGLNIKPDNLKRASHSEKQKRMFARHRALPVVVSEEGRKKSISALKLLNSKQVSQYSMEGKKINTYPSVTIAAEKIGVPKSGIAKAAKAKANTAGGFLWRYGNADEIDIEPVLKAIEKGKKNTKKAASVIITQYTMTGNRVATFSSIQDAAKATGILAVSIGMAARGKQKSAGGFYWKKGYGPVFMNFSTYVYEEALRSHKVYQLSKEREPVQEFKNAHAAARATGIDYSNILGALKGKDRQRTAGGYKWQYADK